MKNIIKKILKESVESKRERFERSVINSLKNEGFDSSTDYKKIIEYINRVFGISGMEAFEMYQLFKDNWRSDLQDIELVRRDKSKITKISSSNRSARDLVANKIPFKGSNTHSEYENGAYVVYSYGWYPIFVFKDGQWFENENRYSMSTAKQMSQLRPYNQGEIIKTSRERLNEIIYRK